MSNWIRLFKNTSMTNYKYNLFCIPYAGGSVSIFQKWQPLLDESGIRVCPIILPGRENRINEPLIDNAQELANQIYDGISSELDRPFLLFGHSMGGIIAYELACLIYERENKLPKILFLSGTTLPDKPMEQPFYRCDDSTFINYLVQNEAKFDEVVEMKKISDKFELVEFTDDHFFINSERINVCKSICSKVSEI